MTRLNRRNLPMKTLQNFNRFVKDVRQMYSDAIAVELKEMGRDDSEYARDLRRDLDNFNEQADRVFRMVGNVADNTPLDGLALKEAQYMLAIGR